MTAHGSATNTRILLSFSSRYAELARRIENDLRAANIEVRYDQWEGGGGVPATQCIAGGVEGVAFVLPLLTPSDAAPTWVGDEWKLAIHDQARARGVPVLPLRGDLCTIPEYLKTDSFADLHGREYGPELRRLVETLRNQSGDTAIKLPDGGRDAASTRSPLTIPAHPLTLEVGQELAQALGGEEGLRDFVDEMAPLMIDGLFFELGVQFPLPHVRVTSEAPWSARIMINDVPEHQVEVWPGSVMVNVSAGELAKRKVSAERAVNPATGAECAWIPAIYAEAAVECGFTTWDAPGFLILTLSAVLRRKAADFIGVEEARAMLELIKPAYPQLVAQTVPKPVPLFLLTDVLRRLVVELVSIRNLRRILLALADSGRVENDPHMLTEYVRAGLRRELTYMFSRGRKQVVVFLLNPEIEAAIHDGMRHTATASYVNLEPARLRAIVDAIRRAMDILPDDVQMPQILTNPEIRASVRRLVVTSMPQLHVVSYQDLRPDVNIQPLGRISLDGFSPRAGVSVGGVPLWG
jgi:type III secretion protein V